MKMLGTARTFCAVLVACFFAGCTGTNMSVTPDPDSLKMTVSKRCGAVAVKESPAGHVYAPAGNLVSGFATAAEKSGIADKVYYPARPDDKVDLTLDATFDVLFDANTGGNMTKSAFTGLTLFILEPVFWYRYNYNLTGKIDIRPQGAAVKTVEATSEAEMAMKFLSLGEAQKLEGDALNKAKASLYKQLLQEISTYCSK